MNEEEQKRASELLDKMGVKSTDYDKWRNAKAAKMQAAFSFPKRGISLAQFRVLTWIMPIVGMFTAVLLAFLCIRIYPEKRFQEFAPPAIFVACVFLSMQILYYLRVLCPRCGARIICRSIGHNGHSAMPRYICPSCKYQTR